MITGAVNSQLEATVRLSLLGRGALQQQFEFLIDAGFSGYISLPPPHVAALQLIWLARAQGMLADGSIEFFDVYRAAASWDGQIRLVEVNVVDTQPLIGMALLERHFLNIDVKNGGVVTIAPSP